MSQPAPKTLAHENTRGSQVQGGVRVSSTRGLRYAISPNQERGLREEARRALSLYRALDHQGDIKGTERLLAMAGEATAARTMERPVISKGQCNRLAQALRNRGYPLDDQGIQRFKLERGYSKVVRLGPDVAGAYARHAVGLETRLEMDKSTWNRLDVHQRRAVRILMHIGRDPQQMIKVRKALELTAIEPTHDGVIPVGSKSAERLLLWARICGFDFSDGSLAEVARQGGLASRRVDVELANFLAECIIAEDEPAHDYKRLRCHGHELNRRTLNMLQDANRMLPPKARLMVQKGSFIDDRSKGAHPHQNGGVVDLILQDGDSVDYVEAVRRLRETGFAAWIRQRGHGTHIHAVAIGDRQLSPAARWQVNAYFAGRDGRIRGDADAHAHLIITEPEWLLKYRIGAVVQVA